MKEKSFAFALTAAMLALSGAAGAAEPIQLSEAQMDAVSAGVQRSTAAATASARIGTASARASTSAYASGPVRITQASALGVALGFGATANAVAGSTY